MNIQQKIKTGESKVQEEFEDEDINMRFAILKPKLIELIKLTFKESKLSSI